MDIYVTNAGLEGKTDKLFRNDGTCIFTDVSSQAGALTSSFHAFGQVLADYDNDGDIDVFSSAAQTANTINGTVDLYRNNGDGTFTDVTVTSGIINESGHGAVWGDYDNDGDVDLYVTNSNYSNTALNRLYQNNGNGTFTEIAQSAGVSQSLGSYDGAWADFNNDGYLDLYVANAGSTENDPPNFLYLNNKNNTFTDVAVSSGAAGLLQGSSGSVSMTDYDNDGFMDIIITKGLSTFSLEGPHELLRNGGNEGKWIKVALIGQQSNRMGVGARVVVSTDIGLTLTRQANGGVHQFSQDEPMLHFGLANSTSITNITVYWPSGIVQTLTNVAPNQFLTITETGASPTPTPTPTPTPLPTSTPTPTPVPLPDLVVSLISFSPSIPVAGDQVSITGRVNNQGSASAGASSTRLAIDIGNNGTWDINPPNQSTGILGVGSVEDENWTNVWTATSGTHKIRVCADNNNVVVESNEGNNNCKNIILTVP